MAVVFGYLFSSCACGTMGILLWCLQALLMETVAMAPDQNTEAPCRSPSEYYTCYDCRTNSDQEEDFCSDPFNSTHPDLNVVQCDRTDYCAKWVVRLESGATQTTRTCSGKLQLHLKIYTVCMTESGSDEGHLCFCEGELCNSATSFQPVTSLLFCVIAASLILTQLQFSVWTS